MEAVISSLNIRITITRLLTRTRFKIGGVYMKKRVFQNSAFFLFIAILSGCPAAPENGTSGGGGGGGGTTYTSYYVATNGVGSDANTGLTKSDPLLSIQKAVELAVAAGHTAAIYVQEGYFTTNAGLTNSGPGITLVSNHNFRFYGGCDTNFDPQAGQTSVLDGRNVLDKVLFIYNTTNFLLDGFTIMRGNATIDTRGGGALVSNVRYSLITTCLFLSNNAWNGAGLDLQFSTSNVISGVFTFNTAGGYGGGVRIYASSYNAFYSVISNNTANQDGGGIIVDGGGNSNLITCIVVTNTANNNGGGIRINAANDTIITGCLINRNTSVTGPYSGGGISLSAHYTYVLNSQINSNSGYQRGAGAVIAGYSLVSNCAFHGNKVTGTGFTSMGGGINITSPYTTIHSCQITGNASPEDDIHGGGIYISGNNCQVISCNISGNGAYSGGGIYINSSYNLITNCVITNNLANLRGGGISFMGAYNTNYSAILNNHVTNGAFNPQGGGIYVGGDYCAVFGIISNNTTPTSGGYGGGLSADAENLWIQATFLNNIAEWGGGIDMRSANSTVQGVIVSNYADRGGSGIRLRFSPANSHNTRFLNIIMTNNDSGNKWGVLSIEGGSTNLTISNCLIGGASASEYGIWEASDITGHTLANNAFLTNSLGQLYLDWPLGNIDITEIDQLNSTNINGTNFTGAAVASGNTAVAQ